MTISSVDHELIAYSDDGILLDATPECAEFLGYSSVDDIVGNLLLDQFSQEGAAELKLRLSECARSKNKITIDSIQVKTQDGRTVNVHLTLKPLPVPDRNLIEIRINDSGKNRKSLQQHPQDMSHQASAAPAEDRPTAETVPGHNKNLDNPWIKRLENALEKDEFALASQPISELATSTDTKSTEKIDILIRLVISLEEEGKEILPGKFLPAAEQAGRMTDIDRWVIDHACDLLVRHEAENRYPMYFLRLSSQSVGDPDTTAWIQNKLNEKGCTPSGLCFEINVADLREEPAVSEKTIKALHELGCQIAISQIGKRQSDIDPLKDIRAEFYKLYPGLIERLDTSNGADHDLVRQLVKIAEKANVKVIAPSVESASTLASLWSCGVHYVQGYLVKHPEIVLES